jgi:hypothetical protein
MRSIFFLLCLGFTAELSYGLSPMPVIKDVSIVRANQKADKVIDYIALLKNDVEKNHQNFIKNYNIEMGKLRGLINALHTKQKDYKSVIKERDAIEKRFILMKKAIIDLKSQYANQNKTIAKIGVADEYEEEKKILNHLSEYIKVYRSSVDKNIFYKKNCICNHTIH